MKINDQRTPKSICAFGGLPVGAIFEFNVNNPRSGLFIKLYAPVDEDWFYTPFFAPTRAKKCYAVALNPMNDLPYLITCDFTEVIPLDVELTVKGEL